MAAVLNNHTNAGRGDHCQRRGEEPDDGRTVARWGEEFRSTTQIGQQRVPGGEACGWPLWGQRPVLCNRATCSRRGRCRGRLLGRGQREGVARRGQRRGGTVRWRGGEGGSIVVPTMRL
uniref:Uncharacterized protein n=1 Tax=Opuntia streptacantha TaxID=393608 RepID=A0A7C8YEU8_OPUST